MIYTHMIKQVGKSIDTLLIFSLGCQYEQHIQGDKQGKKMINFYNSK